MRMTTTSVGIATLREGQFWKDKPRGIKENVLPDRLSWKSCCPWNISLLFKLLGDIKYSIIVKRHINEGKEAQETSMKKTSFNHDYTKIIIMFNSRLPMPLEIDWHLISSRRRYPISCAC